MMTCATTEAAASAVSTLTTPSPYEWLTPMAAIWVRRDGLLEVGRPTGEEPPRGAELLAVLSAPTTAAHVARLLLARGK